MFFLSTTSNIAEAIAKTPGSPEETTTTFFPCKARLIESSALSISSLLSLG